MSSRVFAFTVYFNRHCTPIKK